MYDAFEGEAMCISENDFSSAPSSLSRSITGLLSIGGLRTGTSGESFEPDSILTFSRPLAIELFTWMLCSEAVFWPPKFSTDS